MSTALLMGIDKIPDQCGYFVLNHEGAVLSSAGDFENDEDTANHITEIVHTALSLKLSTEGNQLFKRISRIVYLFNATTSLTSFKKE